MPNISRREFIQSATVALVAGSSNVLAIPAEKITVGAHLWVYASKYPPNWDCTPIIEQVFSDLKYAGIDVLEIMHSNLFHEDAVDKLSALSAKFDLPIIGSFYSGDMWNRERHQQIENECGILFEKLKGTLRRIPDFPSGPDLNWLIRGGVDPVKFIDQYKNQVGYLHIRDQLKNGECSEALGEGDTDFNVISQALHHINFSGVATIELAFPRNFTPTRPIRDSWKISRKFVKENFGW